MGGRQSTTCTITSAELTTDNKSGHRNILYTIEVNIPPNTATTYTNDNNTSRKYIIYRTLDDMSRLENSLKSVFGDGVIASYANNNILNSGYTITDSDIKQTQTSYNNWLNNILSNTSICNAHQITEFLSESNTMEYSDSDDDSDSNHNNNSSKSSSNDDNRVVMKSSTMNLQTVQSSNNLTGMPNSNSMNNLSLLSNPIKDFTLLKVIGKGSFGKVMLVRQNSTQHIYAMKVLYKDQVIQRNQVDHTRTERSVLGYVRHPFIVRLRYAFQSSRKLYLVMDYYAGGELFFHLGRAGRFSEGRAKFYAAQIICALEYLHSKQVVYRDLKPENVLLDNSGYIALTDFGLSKEGITDNTSAQSFCGTPEYLAPEILTRSGHGRAADWWSLGALLYEMLTGMPPFYSRNRDRLFQKILQAEIKFPKFLSDNAKDLLQHLLDRNPVTRLGSNGDAEHIKQHIWFNEIDFDLLLSKKIVPPFKPKIQQSTDTNNFDVEFTNLPIDSVGGSLTNTNNTLHFQHTNKLQNKLPDTDKFAGFSFVNESYVPNVEYLTDDTNNQNDNNDNHNNNNNNGSTTLEQSDHILQQQSQPMQLDQLHHRVASMSLQEENGGAELQDD